MEFMGILQFADRTLCPKTCLLRSVLQCSIFSYSLLFRLWSQFVYFSELKWLFVPKSSRFSQLFGITVTIQTDYAITIYVREVICFYS